MRWFKRDTVSSVTIYVNGEPDRTEYFKRYEYAVKYANELRETLDRNKYGIFTYQGTLEL